MNFDLVTQSATTARTPSVLARFDLTLQFGRRGMLSLHSLCFLQWRKTRWCGKILIYTTPDKMILRLLINIQRMLGISMKCSLFQNCLKYIKLIAPILVHCHITTSLRPWLLPSFLSNDSYPMVALGFGIVGDWADSSGSALVATAPCAVCKLTTNCRETQGCTDMHELFWAMILYMYTCADLCKSYVPTYIMYRVV